MYRSTLWKKNGKQDLFKVWRAVLFLLSFQFSQFTVKAPVAEAQNRPFGHKAALLTVGSATTIKPLRTLILGLGTLFPVSNITQVVSRLFISS